MKSRELYRDGNRYVHLDEDGFVGWDGGDDVICACIKKLVAERDAAEAVAAEAIRQRDHARDLIAGVEFMTADESEIEGAS